MSMSKKNFINEQGEDNIKDFYDYNMEDVTYSS